MPVFLINTFKQVAEKPSVQDKKHIDTVHQVVGMFGKKQIVIFISVSCFLLDQYGMDTWYGTDQECQQRP